MAVQIQIRRGTAAAWTSANPTLAAGEIGFETDTGKLKVGTGSAAWSALSYFSGAGGAVDSVNGQTGAVVLDAGDVGADPSGTAAAALAAHVADADPHAQYAMEDGLADVAITGAYSDLSGLPTLGTAAALNVPASGNAASGEVVKGSDTRLSDARTPTTHTHTASQISDSTSAGRAVLTAADAAAQRVALALSTIARSVYLSSVADGTVVIEAKAAFAFTLNQIRGLKTSAGSVTVSIQIEGVNVTGLNGLSATTTAQDATATAANTVAAGNRITLVLTSTSSAAGLEFTLSATR